MSHWNRQLKDFVKKKCKGILTISVSACGKQEQPVSAELTETVSEEESTEESLEETPSPTVEPTAEPEEESSSSEESLDNSENESDTTEESEEVSETENESTGIEIVEELDRTMYVQTACNVRSGDSTDFEKVTSMTKGASVHVTGRTSNDWYRVDWNNEVVYISSSLLGLEKPAVQQQSSGSTGGNSSSAGTGEQKPSDDDSGDTMSEQEWKDWAESMGMEYIEGGSTGNWDNFEIQ